MQIWIFSYQHGKLIFSCCSIVLPGSALVGKFIRTWAKLALLSLFLSSNPTRPEKYQNRLLSKTTLVKLVVQVELTLFKTTISNFCQMEDDLNFFSNGRRPQLFFKWKTTPFFSNRRRPQILFLIRKTISSFHLNWRQPQLFFNERQP